MNALSNDLAAWTEATSKLKYGEQRVFRDVLQLASEEKTHLVYGRDYHNNMPCLVNTVGGMLTSGGGEGVPMAHFAEVVSLFDSINRNLHSRGVNPNDLAVSPLAADILLHSFAPLKEPTVQTNEFHDPNIPDYFERTDEEMAKAMVELFVTPTINEEDILDAIVDVDSGLAVGRLAINVNNDEGSTSEPPC